MKRIFILTVACFGLLLCIGVSSFVHGQRTDKKGAVDSLIPILGNYPNKSVPLGSSSVAVPDTGASGLGMVTVSVSGNFKGTAAVSPSSGAVRILNASPVGSYTVTVTGSDFAGFSVTRSFTLTVTSTSSCNTLGFAGIASNAENNPFQVVAADFNGDGRQDTATANNGSNSISVLLGNGSGSFGTVTNFSLIGGAVSPVAIAVGDFNGDNKADLAVNSIVSNVPSISVFIGTGTGSFAPAVNYSLTGAGNIQRIVVGDFNGDGRQDIATGSLAGGPVSILQRNAANDGFDALGNLNLSFAVNSIAVADFDRNGRHDLVVGRSGTNTVVALVRNAANNGFDQVSLTISGTVNQVIVGDFNGDGRQDIAAASSGGLDILPRNALGFDAPVNTSGFSINSVMDIGDFNSDGRLDIAFLSSGQVAILYRNATNTNFDGLSFVGSTGFSMRNIAAADFNNDGRADIAVVNQGVGAGPGTVSVLRRNGANASFDLSPTFSSGSTNGGDEILGDFNNDGRQDLAVTVGGTPNIAIYSGSGNGSFTQLTTVLINGNPGSPGPIAAADFNNDGNTDLIVGNNSLSIGGAGFSFLPGTGTGSFGAQLDFFTGFNIQRILVGDFNSDGRQDFVLNRPGTNQTLIYLRSTANSGFDAPVTVSHSFTVNSLAVADVNNDGRDDIAVGYSNSPSFSVVLRNTANTGFDAPVNYSTGNTNGQLTFADFDGDGNQDIAYGANDVLVYYGSATGTFGSLASFGGGIGAGYLETGDFNGDGRQDIVATASNFSPNGFQAQVAVYLRNTTNNGFNAPAGFSSTYLSSFSQKILVGEINGDGRQDLLTFNSPAGPVQWNISVMPRVCTVDLNLTGALPNGAARQSYSKTIYASGGIAPYNFNVTGLPSGLSYTATGDSLTISGTPMQSGQFNVSVTVSDSNPLAAIFKKSDFAPQAANQLVQVLPLQVSLAPTAAHVSVAGRVLTADGRGLQNATVTMTDQNGTVRTVRTSSFGNFRFSDVPAGEIYVFQAVSKKYQFAPQVLAVADDVTELVLTAEE